MSATDRDDGAPDGAPDGAARSRRSPALLATAVALPVAVVVCFVVFVVLARHQQGDAADSAADGHLKSVAAPSAGDAACKTLLEGLPADIGQFHRDTADTADTGDTGTKIAGFARWDGADFASIEVRCGTDRPAELTSTAKLQVVNGVQWVSAAPAGAPAPTPQGGGYWVAVDHRPYVTLWTPNTAGTAAIQILSDAIRTHLQQASLDLGN